MIGRLIYLMGFFGLGKDSLLQVVCEFLVLCGCCIVWWVIMCFVEVVGEDVQVVILVQFDIFEWVLVFVMSWCVNGFCYGILVQIDEWLVQGYDVLVNGLCGYLVQVCWCYLDLFVVLFGVKFEVLCQCLLVCGWESFEEIEVCLVCNIEFVVGLEGLLF